MLGLDSGPKATNTQMDMKFHYRLLTPADVVTLLLLVTAEAVRP